MQYAQELTDAFANAVAVALTELAGAESVLIDSGKAPASQQAGQVSAAIRLSGAATGLLVLGMPAATATALAGRILAETVPNPDRDMIRDCIGEVANIIAGQAKTLLYGTPLHFNFSPPIQDDFEPPSEAEALQLTFGSDAGGFTLTVHPPTAIES